PSTAGLGACLPLGISIATGRCVFSRRWEIYLERWWDGAGPNLVGSRVEGLRSSRPPASQKKLPRGGRNGNRIQARLRENSGNLSGERGTIPPRLWNRTRPRGSEILPGS